MEILYCRGLKRLEVGNRYMQKSSLLRLCGLLFILVVVGLICYVVLYYYGGYFGVTTPTTRIIVITSILLALCYIFKVWQVNALKSVLGAYVPLLKYKAIAYFFYHGSQLMSQM